MSVDIPAWGAGEMMVKAKKKLFKMGWKQSENGRLDCIEKTFGDIIVRTIWAGHILMLNPRRVGFPENSSELESYIPLDDPVIAEAKSELEPIFGRIVRRNKKKWDAKIKEYEKQNNIVFIRSQKYGV